MKSQLTILSVVFALGTYTTVSAHEECETITAIKPELSENKVSIRKAFIGKWHSKQPTKDGSTRETIIQRLPDSQYLIEFKFFDAKGNLEKSQKEFGFWGVSGGIYFTMFRGQVENDKLYEVDPTDAYNYDSYKIINTSPQELIYQSLSSGNKYTYDRIQ